MIRAWDEAAAALFDVVPGPLLLLGLLVVAAIGGALWYYWPAWLPGPRRPRSKKKRTKRTKTAKAEVITAAEPEDEPVEAGELGLADRLAAEGRYAEAIRQRLRDVIRDLVEAGVLAPQPGWTAAELAALAGAQRPAVGAPLGAATELFSDIWYGARPAGAAQDDRMRLLTAQVRADLVATA
jgi:Domain of unknown function (DUF4129)